MIIVLISWTLHNLQYMARRSSDSQLTQKASGGNEMLALLIMEAMSAMETTDKPINSDINQYNWRHLFYLVSHAICTQYANFTILMDDLATQLEASGCQKARSEIMWLILQVVSLTVGRQTINQQSSEWWWAIGLSLMLICSQYNLPRALSRRDVLER